MPDLIPGENANPPRHRPDPAGGFAGVRAPDHADGAALRRKRDPPSARRRRHRQNFGPPAMQ